MKNYNEDDDEVQLPLPIASRNYNSRGYIWGMSSDNHSVQRELSGDLTADYKLSFHNAKQGQMAQRRKSLFYKGGGAAGAAGNLTKNPSNLHNDGGSFSSKSDGPFLNFIKTTMNSGSGSGFINPNIAPSVNQSSFFAM